MASKKKPATTMALVPITPNELVTAASQVKVVMEINGPALQEEVAEHTKGFDSLLLQAKQMQVDSEEKYQECVTLRNDAAKREKGLTAVWKRLKDPLNQAREVVLRFEHGTVDAITGIKDMLTAKAEEYLNDQKRVAVETQKVMDQAARVQRRDLQDQADDLMAQGFVKEADKVRRQAQMTVAPTMGSPVPTAEGARVGTKYDWKCVDFVAFCRAVVDGEVDFIQEVKPGDERQIIKIDEVVMNAVVARQGDGLRWPGIVVTASARLGAQRL